MTLENFIPIRGVVGRLALENFVPILGVVGRSAFGDFVAVRGIVGSAPVPVRGAVRGVVGRLILGDSLRVRGAVGRLPLSVFAPARCGVSCHAVLPTAPTLISAGGFKLSPAISALPTHQRPPFAGSSP